MNGRECTFLSFVKLFSVDVIPADGAVKDRPMGKDSGLQPKCGDRATTIRITLNAVVDLPTGKILKP